MPSQLEIRKKLSTRTERVKSVCFHSSEPWIVSALYSGVLLIHNWEKQSIIKTIEVCPSVPIRCVRFMPQNQWIICGSDDMMIRVFNYHTLEKVKEFYGHNDFIRYIAIHPKLPYVLTTSDDTTVRLWDWSKDWTKIASFENHLHYVMMCQWNPRDPHIFATASLDRTIKIWGIHSPGMTGKDNVITRPHFSLVGHENGVNCVEYASSSDKPYIVSGGDDKTVRVWDYQTRMCIAKLTEHQKVVLCTTFHPFLPIILSAGEDQVVKVWHSTTYRHEMNINCEMGRIWNIAVDTKTKAVAFATDEGTIVMKLGADCPVASMQGGKIILAKGTDIVMINLKLINHSLYNDGEILPYSAKDMGVSDIFPQLIQHHPKGRLVSVLGDNEYVIYTSQALRSKAFGSAQDFAWSNIGDYAIRKKDGKISIHRNFKEEIEYDPMCECKLFGGHLLGVRSNESISFYDWKDFKLKRRINVYPHQVYWSDLGTSVVLACEDVFYQLRYDPNAVNEVDPNVTDEELENDEGIESAFELEKEALEHVDSGCWVSDCFAFTTKNLKLYILAAGATDNLAFLEKPAWILGYFEETNCLYLIDQEYNIISYHLYLSYVKYVSAIIRHDYDGASVIFNDIPESLHNKVARFLEWQGQCERALQVTHDMDHKFELARSLGKLNLCAEILQVSASAKEPEDAASHYDQWRQIGDLALEQGSIKLAEACFKNGKDYNSLFLIYSSTGDLDNICKLAQEADAANVMNIAMICYILIQDHDKCIDLLIRTNRIPEAALFARTYCPSKCHKVIEAWKEKLIEAKYTAIANALIEPTKNPERFPEYEQALKTEKECFGRPYITQSDSRTKQSLFKPYSSPDPKKSIITQSDTKKSISTESDAKKSITTKSNTKKSITTESDAKKSIAIESNAEQPSAGQSYVVQSDIEHSDIEHLDIEQSDIEQSDIVQSDIEQSDIVQSDTEQSDAEQPVVNSVLQKKSTHENSFGGLLKKTTLSGTLFAQGSRQDYSSKKETDISHVHNTYNKREFNKNINSVDSNFQRSEQLYSESPLSSIDFKSNEVEKQTPFTATKVDYNENCEESQEVLNDSWNDFDHDSTNFQDISDSDNA